jgi:hypothetical protein
MCRESRKQVSIRLGPSSDRTGEIQFSLRGILRRQPRSKHRHFPVRTAPPPRDARLAGVGAALACLGRRGLLAEESAFRLFSPFPDGDLFFARYFFGRRPLKSIAVPCAVGSPDKREEKEAGRPVSRPRKAGQIELSLVASVARKIPARSQAKTRQHPSLLFRYSLGRAGATRTP